MASPLTVRSTLCTASSRAVVIGAATALLLAACNAGAAPAGSATSSPTSHSGSVSGSGSTARPGHHLVDPDLGQKIDAFFAADTAGFYRNRRAVIVTVDGQVAAARYLKSTPTDTWDIQTAGTAVTATLIGIALDHGQLHRLSQTLADLLPSYRPLMTNDVQGITLGQVLAQTAEFPSDDVFYRRIWGTSLDWVLRVLRDGPTYGGGFDESSADAHLLSAILAQATGQSTLAYARANLFAPLGISTTPAYQLAFLPANSAAYQNAAFAWPTDPQGRNLGGGFQKLTALDLAKLGQFWLDTGRWQGHQLVSADFAARMQSPLQLVGTEADGAPLGYGYGLYTAVLSGHTMFAAYGRGGQLVEAIPDLGVVVTVLSQSPINPLTPVDAGTTEDGSDYNAFVSAVVEPAVH